MCSKHESHGLSGTKFGAFVLPYPRTAIPSATAAPEAIPSATAGPTWSRHRRIASYSSRAVDENEGKTSRSTRKNSNEEAAGLQTKVCIGPVVQEPC